MLPLSLLAFTVLASFGVSHPVESYVDWRTFHATGVNLGGWLEQEANINPDWWAKYGGTPDMDEWTWCQNLGAECGPVLEEHYATYITTDFIDKLASVGTNVIRIPTTYAAWIKVPGSQLYSGHQAGHLSKITTYAIEQHGMHVLIDLHSLPGGINGLDIGEASGHLGWFNNDTNLEYSLQAVDKVLEFIVCSGHQNHFTLEPINEPMDNLSAAFTPGALSATGLAWVKKYFDQVVEHTVAINPKIPVAIMTFQTESFWSSQFDKTANIVFDQHIYFFQDKSVTSANVSSAFCQAAQAYTGDGVFPVFIGEWNIETGGNNSLADRKHNVQVAQYAWNKYTQGSAMWNGRHFGNVAVPGEGVLRDYWNYEDFVDMGFIEPVGQLQDLCEILEES